MLPQFFVQSLIDHSTSVQREVQNVKEANNVYEMTQQLWVQTITDRSNFRQKGRTSII